MTPNSRGGGSDPASVAFLVAAVAISAANATRLVKSFRKATGFTGEVKGHRFSFAQRATFLGLLAKRPDAVSVVVACQRCNAVDGWAMDALPETELCGLLLAEAYASLPGLNLARHIAVTADQSRCKRTLAEPARAGLVQAVAARHPAAKHALPLLNHTSSLPAYAYLSNGIISTCIICRCLL